MKQCKWALPSRLTVFRTVSSGSSLPPCFSPTWPGRPFHGSFLALRALPYRSPLQPLGLAALSHSFVKRSPCPPRRARGPRPPPGALPCVSPGGVRGPLSGSGRPAPPGVVGDSPAVALCGMRLFLLAALLLSLPSSLLPVFFWGGQGPLCRAFPPAAGPVSPVLHPCLLFIFPSCCSRCRVCCCVGSVVRWSSSRRLC